MKKFVTIAFLIMMQGVVWGQFNGGDGSSSAPYQVATATQLNNVRNYLSAYFIQTADIDLNISPYNTGSGWVPIGDGATKFTGNYDGNGHIISNLLIDSYSSYMGLFGYTNGAVISKLGLVNVDITGSGNLGALAGQLTGGSVSQCYSTGSVTNIDAGEVAGGLAGGATTCIISNCYSRANVSGETLGGGLIGQIGTSSSLTNCYSAGTVTNDAEDGYSGLIDLNFSSSNTFVVNCFWDTESSGEIDSDGGNGNGGTGKTTVAMKTLATFTDITTTGLTTAWDFETNPNDDTADDDIWDIDLSGTINNGYPYLAWQDGGERSLPVELSSFTAVMEHNSVLLQWQTESETDNLGFILERKEASAKAWSVIADYRKTADLQGKDNSSSISQYSYTDKNITTGSSYEYRLSDVNIEGKTNILKSVNITTTLIVPEKTTLLPAYPNPFNPETRITWHLAESANVNITVVDLLGRTVSRILTDQHQESGVYNTTWHGRDDLGLNCPSGIYLVVLRAGNYTAAQKVMLVR